MRLVFVSDRQVFVVENPLTAVFDKGDISVAQAVSPVLQAG